MELGYMSTSFSRVIIIYLYVQFTHMDTKLTLSLDKEIIEAAKAYARNRNTSLSNLVENYLVSVTSRDKVNADEISPLVKSLSGVLKPDKKVEGKKQYSDYLANKYE